MTTKECDCMGIPDNMNANCPVHGTGARRVEKGQMADRVERDLQWILDQPVNNWQVEGKCIVSTKEGTVLPLLRDRALSDEALQVIADALNFVVKRGALQLLAKRLAALALPAEPPRLPEPDWRGMIEAIAREAVELAIMRSDLTWDESLEQTEADIAQDAADALFGDGTCAEEPTPSAKQLLAQIGAMDWITAAGASATPASRSQAKRIALQSGTPEIYKCLQIIEENAGKVADSDTSVQNHASARLIESAVQRIRNAGASATPAPPMKCYEVDEVDFPVTPAPSEREYAHKAIYKVLEMRKYDLAKASDEAHQDQRDYYLGRAHRCDDILFWLGHEEAKLPAGTP